MDNPLVALLDDADGLPEFHELLAADWAARTGAIEAADTILSHLVPSITDAAIVAAITAHEALSGVVWGEPCGA